MAGVDVRMTAGRLLRLLKDARGVIYDAYLAAGGDDEAKGNPSLLRMGKLLDRLDKALEEK